MHPENGSLPKVSQMFKERGDDLIVPIADIDKRGGKFRTLQISHGALGGRDQRRLAMSIGPRGPQWFVSVTVDRIVLSSGLGRDYRSPSPYMLRLNDRQYGTRHFLKGLTVPIEKGRRV